MKKLIIPESCKDTITVNNINNNFKGIIIGYNNSKPNCYIQYDSLDCDWGAFISINNEDIYSNAVKESLNDLLNYLLQEKYCDSFNVIEFEN